MSFNLLYPTGADPSVHATHLALYMQGWAEGLGITRIVVDLDALDRLCADLAHPDFPHVDGEAKSSPFKKVANFFVWCVLHKPITSVILPEVAGHEICTLPNHQNVFFAYHFSTLCLHGATLNRKDGKKVTLENRIRISHHSLCDLVDTYGTVVPYQHFKPVCLLFEQMAYKANPNAPYKEVF